MPLIDNLCLNDVATCSRGGIIDRVGEATRCGPPRNLPLHYQQSDKWSCGFRNLQMMLSALLPNFPANHPYFCMNRSEILCNRKVLSLYQLQSHLEDSWAGGFDPRGARHYGHKIRGRSGRSSWIGAVEVSSVLSYLHIDSTVVQFIHRQESRALLGDFVWCYFSKKIGIDACYFCSRLSTLEGEKPTKTTSSPHYPTSTECAVELIQFAMLQNKEDVAVECCQCPLPPLYLQWEGHSVTIVGIQKVCGEALNGRYDLLIFDPMKSGRSLKNSLAGWQPGGKSCLAPMRLPTNDLLHLDCQIVLCSLRSLTSHERQRCRTKVNALTAGETIPAPGRL